LHNCVGEFIDHLLIEPIISKAKATIHAMRRLDGTALFTAALSYCNKVDTPLPHVAVATRWTSYYDSLLSLHRVRAVVDVMATRGGVCILGAKRIGAT
jgi:hypothetical protein